MTHYTEKEISLFGKVRELMFRYGIKNLTMDDIAQHLGISKKTLYQVVDNKVDLVDKILDQTISQHQQGLNCILQEGENAIEELLKIYKHNSAMAKRMHAGLSFELRKYFPQVWGKVETFRQEVIFKCVFNNLQKGIADGLFRPDINVGIVARLYAARTLDVFNPDMFPPQEFPTDVVLKEMFVYHVRGIASEKGLKYLEENVVMEL